MHNIKLKMIVLLAFLLLLISFSSNKAYSKLKPQELYNLVINENNIISVFLSDPCYYSCYLPVSPIDLMVSTFDSDGNYIKPKGFIFLKKNNSKVIHPLSGKIYELTNRGGKYRITIKNDKEQVIKTKDIELLPDIKDSIISSIHIDSSGSIYILNIVLCDYDVKDITGSIRKYDSNLNLLMTIKDNIGYLREMAIDSNNYIYTIEIDEYIRKYDKNGHLIQRWSATPPIYGESWKEKMNAEKIANTVDSKSSVPDLVKAFAYSDYEGKKIISQWLKLKNCEELQTIIDIFYVYWDVAEVLLLMVQKICGDDIIIDSYKKIGLLEIDKKRYLATYMAQYIDMKKLETNNILDNIFEVLLESVRDIHSFPQNRSAALYDLIKYYHDKYYKSSFSSTKTKN